MRLRLSLQGRVLLLFTLGMTLIVLLSSYLHALFASSDLEEDRYGWAIWRTVDIARKVAATESPNPDELHKNLVFFINSIANRRDFAQVDVYQPTPAGVRRAATSASPTATPLPVLDEHTPDNDLHEMERPISGVVTMEEYRKTGSTLTRYWLITVATKEQAGTGYVTSLVVKNSFNPLVSELQQQHNAILAGVALVCVALAYVLFVHFFKRPARNIVQAMMVARGGNFGARAVVKRDDELGEIGTGFNSMMDDLSARDREREALLARISGFNDQLRGEVARATSELRAVNEELFQSQQQLGRTERLAALGQVAASLAHEIGTPLNSIAGHLQLLARRHPDDGDMQRRVGIIGQQLDFIVQSVRALLQRTHKRRSVLRPTDINGVLRDTLRLVGPTLETHGIAVAASLASSLPPVLADRDSLRQVFLNLINNSIDAMPTGGRVELVSALDADSRLVEVIVRDNGPGIPAEHIDHLFEPLWTTKPTGSGFGLAIAREIMNEHGGGIDVDRTRADGAAFRLRLPLADAPVPA